MEKMLLIMNCSAGAGLHTSDYSHTKDFVGDIFMHLFLMAGLAAAIIIISYTVYVLWRDRKTRPLSVKIKDYISDCQKFWSQKQVKDTIKDVGYDFLKLILIFSAIGLGIYAYINWL